MIRSSASPERPGTTTDGYIGYPLASVFSSDGTRLYFAAHDGYVHVADVTTGALVACWPCHGLPIMDLRRSHDGARLLSASLDGTVGVWDAKDGHLVCRLAGHRGGVHSLDVSNAHIAAGGFDGTVRLWDAVRFEPLATIDAHRDAVTAVSLLSSGRLVSGARDRAVRVWDLRTGACLRVLEGHRWWVTKLGALPDGTHVISAGEDGRCILWDCERGEAVWRGRIEEPIWGLAVAPNGEFAVTGSTVTRWEVATGKSRTLDGVTGERALAISADSARVACARVIYDPAEDRVLCKLARMADDAYVAAAVDTRGERVAVGHQPGTVTLFEADGSRRALDGGHRFMAYTLCRVGTDRFASGGFDGTVRIWDFASGTLRAQLDHGRWGVFSVSASQDGRYLVSAGSDRCCLWDLQTRQAITCIDPLGSGTHSEADIAADASLIVTVGDDDLLRRWRPDGTLLGTITHGCEQVPAVRLLPDHSGAVLGDSRGRVSILDFESGNCDRLHAEHEDWIRAVHVTDDGRFVVSASQNYICRVYDREARRLVATDVLRAPVPAAAVGTNGVIFAVSALGEILRIGAPVQSGRAHDDQHD
jgi:WD40 repeat protein